MSLDFVDIIALIFYVILGFPLIGMFFGAFIWLAWGFIDELMKKGDEWKKQYGEIKSLYAVSWIIGIGFHLLIIIFFWEEISMNYGF